MSNVETIDEADLDDIPVFPLAGCVLFPHTVLPLHIFEERFRAMTRDVVASNRLLVIANGEGAQRGCLDGHVASLGKIIDAVEENDGRWHILVCGLARLRIESELDLDAGGYRRVAGTLLWDLVESEDRLEAERRSIRQLCIHMEQLSTDASEQIQKFVSQIEDPSTLADVLCAATLETSDARQETLEDLSVESRLKRASSSISTYLLRNVKGTVH